MNYWSINEDFLKDHSVIKEYRAIIDNHYEYFKDKDLDSIIKLRWFVEHETGAAAEPAQVLSTTYFDVRILRSKMPTPEIMAEMNELKFPPVIVDYF